MFKALLALFLTFSLATQVASLSAQLDSERHFLHAPGQVRPYNTDFDDDRRGLKPFPVAVRDLSFTHAKLVSFADSGELLVDSCFVRLALFKLHAALLI